MSDSPPQAIHGLLSASPGRDAASAIRYRGFFRQPKIKSRRAHRPDLRRSGLRPPTCFGSFAAEATRSEEHTSELQSLMRISYAVFCLKKKTLHTQTTPT